MAETRYAAYEDSTNVIEIIESGYLIWNYYNPLCVIYYRWIIKGEYTLFRI